MKFARYLQDTQTPEWKKAYIDYRGLKKRIAAIVRWQEGLEPLPSSSAEDTDTGSTSRSVHSSRPIINAQPRSLYTVLSTLSPVHLAFFTFLDAQLEKVETFYLEREKEATARSKALEAQLGELKDHRRLYYEAHPNQHLSWAEIITSNIRSLPSTLTGSLHAPKTRKTPSTHHPESIRVRAVRKASISPHRGSQVTEVEVDPTTGPGTRNGKGKHPADPADGDIRRTGTPSKSVDAAGTSHKMRLDPEEYQNARKKLKKAVLEHYRGLEVLNNYRVLNITGFRKALKKYEKVTKVAVQQAYVKERVETSAFFSGAAVTAMIKEMEELFAARFERGDKKQAMVRLRAGSQHKSHHFSTFRTGVALGLAVPAILNGIYQSFQPGRRAALPSWQVLCYIYGILLIPVLFGLMVGINVLVWSEARINYVFIFELDVRTRLDHREYFEIPAILFATLAYAFSFSFSGILSPTLWPLVWLLFAFVLLVNPLPIIFKPSRWWLIRSVSDLLVSGVHQVEFSDFWMGDQFCSLVFTLSGLYFIGCAYATDFPSSVWQQCGPTTKAGLAGHFALSMLPLLVRLVQSLRRYFDSRLITHLINGGKYGAGIIYYIFYYLWRFHGVETRGWNFAFWFLSATFYATYACIWDFLMDWSLLKPHSKYPLLRPELVYSSIPFYYFALISNLLIRFIWVLFIPRWGPSTTLRTFIFAMLEMLRRWQWNFYRLENEHLGNMDQYRVTREVPLPYSVDTGEEEEEDGDEDAVSTRRSWRRQPSSTSLRSVVR